MSPIPSFLSGLACLLLGYLPARAQTADSFNPDPDYLVKSIAVQADGKILLGGGFHSLGGQNRDQIARLNADGSLDSGFSLYPSGDVSSLVVQTDGKVLVGGYFTTLGVQTRNRLARLNADGSLDTGFNPNANNHVISQALQADGKILIGGYFTALGGQVRNRLARLNADGSLDTGFNPNVGSVFSDVVSSLAVQADGKILVGGQFTTLGGQTRNHIARVNADGSLDTSFNPNANSFVQSLAIQADGKILVGGAFDGIGGQTRNRIARLNANGSLDTAFNPNANSAVYSLAVQADGKILIGGYFEYVGGQPCNRIARLNADGSFNTAFNPNADNYVLSLGVQADGKVLVGGGFNTLGGQTRNYLARLTNDTVATSALAVTGTSQIDWTRGGSAPELSQVTFESWTGSAWTSLGSAIRVSGGWRMTGLTLPVSGQIRARGRTSGGQYNASSGLTEQIVNYPSLPDIALDAPTGSPRTNGSGALEFDPTAVGQTRDIGVTLKNTGNSPLTGISPSISFSYLEALQFDLVGNVPSTLAAGASAAFTIRFSPTSSGSKSATLSIASNDPDENPFTLTLTGTGSSSGTAAISAGGLHSLILRTDGSVWAAGRNDSGQLGDGTTTARSSPVMVLSGIKSISAGQYHSLFLKNDGSAWAVGSNDTGQLGDGSSVNRLTPVQVLTGVQAISAGDFHSLFLKTDGTVWATGWSASGQLGDGVSGIGSFRSIPVQVLGNAQAVAAGGRHSLFLKVDGSVWATGSNSYGALGDGTTNLRNTPDQVATGMKAVAAGEFHSIFLKTDNTAWTTGRNDYGQLGDGTTVNKSTPVFAAFNIKAVEAGFYHSLFRNTDNTVWAAGSNSSGQLGDGTTTQRINSIQTLINNVHAVSGGWSHSLFLKTDGTVWATGLNVSGQLGNSTTTSLRTPAETFIVSISDIALEAPTGTPVTNGNGTLAFASTGIGQPKDLAVTLLSIGSANLNTIAASLTGPDVGMFTLVSTPPTTLAAGASAPFTIRFSPTSLGSKSATLSIVSDDPDENPFTLTLTGNGTDISLPTVISWSFASDPLVASSGAFPPQEIQVRIADASGFLSGSIQFSAPGILPPGSSTTVNISHSDRISGVPTDSVYRVFLNIPAVAEALGIWTLQGFLLGDLAGNSGFVLPSGYSPTFQVTVDPALAWQQAQFGTDAGNPSIAGPLADPDHDGIVNLLERAFNLSPLQAGATVLTLGTGITGLPLVRTTQGPGGPILTIQYIRRKASTNSGLVYTPQVSSSLDANSGWSVAAGTETVESIDTEWERVTVADTNPLAQTTRFGRVKVVASP